MPQVSLFRKMPFGFLRIVDQYVNYNNNALQHYSIEQDSDDGVLYLTPFPTNHAVEKTYDCGFAFPYRTDINTNTNSTTAKVREIARYDPVWCSDYVFTCQGVNCFQWYMSPPLRTTEDDVVLCDAVNKRYPVVNGRFRTLPHFMCKNDSVPVNITGNLNAGIVFDNPALRDIYDNVSGLCFCGPYLDENLNPVSYQDKPSAYPLFRFETSFTQPETPMFVEFMHTNPYTAMGMTTPDAFRYGGGGRNGGSGSLGSWFSWGGTLDQSRVVYPKHILIEGRLKQADPWEILDVVELPERALNFPLFHLSYTRTVRFLRFTVLSIHYAPTMQITVTEQGRSNTKAVVNTFPQYFYFPRTLFYPKNPKFL
jgi:hypothetical protein